jgi:hypothetical protein
MEMAWLVLILSVLRLHWVHGYREDNDGLLPNQHWRCTGCFGDAQAVRDVYNQVHTAARRHDRLSYLALDMGWLDRLNLVDSRVHVVLEGFHRMHSVVPPERRKEPRVVLSEYSEELQVLAFHFKGYTGASAPSDGSSHDGSSTAAAAGGSAPWLTSPAQRRYHAAIDRFLAVNPCWVPLHEPATPPLPSGRRRGSELLLFIRLPDVSYHATCRLFTAVVKRQFPPVCHYRHVHVR